MDERSYENILIYDVSYKTLIGVKPLPIIYNKVDGFIRKYHGTKYLVFFATEKYDAIFDSIRYLISLKSFITYVSFLNYPKIKIDSDNDLLLAKTLTLHNVVILTKSVFNKNQSHYYYNMILEKCLKRLAKK